MFSCFTGLRRAARDTRDLTPYGALTGALYLNTNTGEVFIVTRVGAFEMVFDDPAIISCGKINRPMRVIDIRRMAYNAYTWYYTRVFTEILEAIDGE